MLQRLDVSDNPVGDDGIRLGGCIKLFCHYGDLKFLSQLLLYYNAGFLHRILLKLLVVLWWN